MKHLTDQQLLCEYARSRAETAFAELVRRHIDLIHSAAFRLTGEAHSAQDVTQAVFVALAQNATGLTQHPILAGWLHTTARNLAAKHVRAAVRRQHHEQEAAAMNELLSSADVSWEEIAPHLDAALGELGATDRDAVLLRYFNNHDLRAVGSALGISDAAAQKRVSRAVERLREFFVKRGVTVGASGLAVVISANAVQAAPVGLALTISTAAALTGTTLATAATVTATKAIAMTAFQKTIVTATLAAAVGTGIYEAHRASELNGQVRSLQQQLSPLAAQIEALQHDQSEASNRLAALQQENQLLRRNTPELLRLRAEVNRLRAELLASMENTPTASEAKSWLARVNELKQKLEAMPEQKIPELELLGERDWLNVARDVEIKNDASVRSAFARLRKVAKEKFAPLLSAALRAYARANNNQVPPDLLDLQPFFGSPVNPEILARYQLLQTESLTWDEPAIAEKAAVDERTDILFKIGAGGTWYASVNVAMGGESGSTTWSTTDPPSRPPWIEQLWNGTPARTQRDDSELERILERPIREHLAALNGKEPKDPAELVPYLKTAEEKAAWQKMQQNEVEDQRELQAIEAYVNDSSKLSQPINAFLAANKKYPESPSELTPYLKTPEEKAALDRLLERSGKK